MTTVDCMLGMEIAQKTLVEAFSDQFSYSETFWKHWNTSEKTPVLSGLYKKKIVMTILDKSEICNRIYHHQSGGL